MRKFTWLLALAIPVTIISCQKDAVQAPNEDAALVQGNLDNGGTLSGAHYNLNIIGVANPKTADMDGTSGHSLFVGLGSALDPKRTDIWLSPGDFDVTDRNGTDADGAAFSLPYVSEGYRVYARALGKPGGEATMTNCAYWDDPNDNIDGLVEICEIPLNTEILTLKRGTGKSSFTDVSTKLLYIYVDITDDDVYNPQRYPIFDDALENYFWKYDNKGLRIMQLRFYENVSTN